MKTLFCSLLLVTWISIEANVWDDPCHEMIYSKEACIVEIEEFKFFIFSDGRINFGPEVGKLSLDDGFGLDWLRDAVVVGESAFFCFDVSDSLYGSSIIFSVSLSTKKINWQSELKGFNGSKLLISDGDVYAGAFDTVAKFDAETGSLIWEHTGLYDDETSAFNSFERPEIEKDVVIFTESKNYYAKYQGRKKLIVSRTTGQILSP